MDLELLAPDELCELLKVKKSWLYDQVGTEAIPYVKLGKQLRFSRAEIGDYLRQRSNDAHHGSVGSHSE